MEPAQVPSGKPVAVDKADHLSNRTSSVEEDQTPDDGAKLEEVQTEDVQYPSGAKVLVIMGSLYISMFLVALDRTIIATAIPRITDEFNSIDVSSTHDQLFDDFAKSKLGHWLVRLRVFVDGLRLHSLIRAYLHFLLFQMDFPLWYLLLRGRLRNMWRSPQFDSTHRGPCYQRVW